MTDITDEEFKEFMRLKRKIDRIVKKYEFINMDDDNAPNAWPLTTEENLFFFNLSRKVDPEGTDIAVEHLFEDEEDLVNRLASVAARNRSH